MIVARIAGTDETVEAHRELGPGNFECPTCRGELWFKRGRTVIPHFAHKSNVDCPASEGESRSHMQAKVSLARTFRAQGLSVVLEQAHPQHGRRIDLVVALPAATGGYDRIAVEVQNSRISVPEIRRRHQVDSDLGYYAIIWVFTLDRVPRLIGTLPSKTLQMPDEMLYLVNRWAQPLNFIDTKNDWILHGTTEDAYADVTTYYDADGDDRSGGGYRLKKSRYITLTRATHRLARSVGKYDRPRSPDPTVVFAPARHTDPPWAAMYDFSPKLLALMRSNGFRAPTPEEEQCSSWLIAGDTQHEVLRLLNTLTHTDPAALDDLKVSLFNLHSHRMWIRPEGRFTSWEFASEHS